MSCDGDYVCGTVNCPYPAQLNNHFSEQEQFGFNWLQAVGIVSHQTALDELGATQSVSSQSALEKINRLRHTNITLLGALTVPNVDAERLQLATMVNGWLFTLDNEFDKSDSPFMGNPDLTRATFEAFEKAFAIGEKVLPPAIPINIREKFQAFLHGIAEIGAEARELCPEFEREIAEGLVLYKTGNIRESHGRGDTRKVLSISSFM